MKKQLLLFVYYRKLFEWEDPFKSAPVVVGALAVKIVAHIASPLKHHQVTPSDMSIKGKYKFHIIHSFIYLFMYF